MAARPDIVDIEFCDVIGELKVQINSRIFTDCPFNSHPPVICPAYFLNAELLIQILLRHNPKTDKIEAYVEVLSGPPETLTFRIIYGILPFHPYRMNPQIFVCTTTNRRSQRYPVCQFNELLDFSVDNQIDTLFRYAEFVSTIIISARRARPVLPDHRIPSINDPDCDHTIVCEGREVMVHSRLIRLSRFFNDRLTADPRCTETNIDELDVSKRITMDVLTRLLSFMYGLWISDHDLQTVTLLSAAREYQLDTLFNVCELRMIGQLRNSTAAEMFYIGRTERASRLAFEAAKFILANYHGIKKTIEWDGCVRAFRTFFEPILPNPLRYFRGIIFPDVRSRSTDDIRTGARLILPRTHPLRRGDPDTETTSMTGSRSSSQNTSKLSCSSLELDTRPSPGIRRSSPVITRRDSDALPVAWRAKSVDEGLPRIKFSREYLKNRLLASELNFNPFGSSDSFTSDSSRSLSRSLSLPDDSGRSRSDDYRNQFPAMDCSEDNNLTSRTSTKSESQSPDSMGPGAWSGERPDLSSPSLPSMRSLEFGLTYSYSSDSVFEHRETPKSMSKVPTSPVDMSISEYPRYQEPNSSPVRRIDFDPNSSPIRRIDFTRYTHPEARSLSDISSIPQDSSLSIEPESSASTKPRSRREKRMKKMAEKTRKFLPAAALNNAPFDFSSSDGSFGIKLPRPTFGKEPPQEHLHIPSQPKKDTEKKSPTSRPTSELSSSSASSPSEQKPLKKKVSFGSIAVIPPPEHELKKIDPDQQLCEVLQEIELNEDCGYYESWLETAAYYNISGVFEEATSSGSRRRSTQSTSSSYRRPPTPSTSSSYDHQPTPSTSSSYRRRPTPSTSSSYEHQPIPSTSSSYRRPPTPSTSSSYEHHQPTPSEDVEKSWDEKDEDELTAPLLHKIRAERHEQDKPPSSSRELPIGGGVIRKTPGRFNRRASVDEPTPLSSSETVGTTSESPSSSGSAEMKKGRQTFVSVRTVRRSISNTQQQQRRSTPSLAGVFTIGMQENVSQPQEPQQTREPQQPQEPPQHVESENDKKKEPVDVNIKPKPEKDNQ